jgi:hypothetical protein
MFNDLVHASNCANASFVREAPLDVLYQEMLESGVHPLAPSGFVFHQSRCGSTLIANQLASVPNFLVYTEPLPVLEMIHLYDTSIARRTALRKLLFLMGASPFHDRLFIKFPSSGVTVMKTLLDVFPTTPWIFAFRDPVQIVVSHLTMPAAQVQYSCLREHHLPRPMTCAVMGMSCDVVPSTSSEEFCAGHLAMLSQVVRKYSR